MRLKMLISIPYFFGYEKAIKEAVALYSNFEVHLMVYDDYHFDGYKNSVERVYSFSRKLLKLKRYKDVVFENNLKAALLQFPENHFDLYLGIRPDFMENETLDTVQWVSKRLVAYYWDSVERAPRFREVAHYFDTVFSYDPYDCKTYGYTFATNFYVEKQQLVTTPKINTKVFCFMAYDPYRIESITKIQSSFRKQQITSKIFIFKQRKSQIPEALSSQEGVIIRRTPMPIDEVFENYSVCDVVLDICNIGNRGLSLRTFETMYLRKKLITTNEEIKKYPFYNENNIYVLKDTTHDIPKVFFETSYEDIPTEIFEKYSIKFWVETMIKITDSSS